MPKRFSRRPSQTLGIKLGSTLSLLSQLPKAYHLFWTAAQGWTIAWGILLIVQGLLPAATIYLTKLLVDNLVAAIKIGLSEESLELLLLPGALMATILALTEVLQAILNWIRTIQAELVQDYISCLIHKKAVAVDLGFYESPEYHDKLERARSDASTRCLGLLENSGSLLQNSITLLAMATVLLPYGAWLPFVLIISLLPAFFVVLHTNWEQHQWWQRTTQDRRWTNYYNFMLTDSYVAAELRLFDLGGYFQSSYQQLRHKLRRERIQLIKSQSFAQLSASTLGLAFSGGAIAWMVWQALQGLITLGSLALFYQALNAGQSLMRTLIGNVGQIYANSLFLGNLFEFLKLETQIIDPIKPLPIPLKLKEGICFRDVTFRYPGSDRAALENFHLTVGAGKVTAIVGDNGAGKSTLIKLLCHFYEPEDGCIEIDGIDIRHLSIAELRRSLTVLFQFPINYHATAGQNIAQGDLQGEPSFGDIETAARGAGAHEVITRLPHGYDTLLGKWFADGVDLSGGELQRIALARAFLRKAQIIVLDEPTSAMDPWAEHDWLERFRTMAQGRTAIVITHRFTLAMRADIIHVMRAGQIVESGSHDELLIQGGFYAQSWKSQMQTSSSAIAKSNII